MLFVEDVGTSTDYRRGEEYDINPEIAPRLRIEWTPEGVKSTTPLQLGWPTGAHQNSAQEGDDIRHRVRYCTTHDLYIYKTAVWMESSTDFYHSRLKKRYTVFPNR